MLACATTGESAAEEKCLFEPSRMPGVSVAEAFGMTSQQVACYGNELRLDCGLIHGISADDRLACRTYAAAVLTYLQRDSSAIVRPSEEREVTYEDSGVCIDTFISGRELDDCFDFIQAKIPLVPNESLERARAE
jgi:hypothetical protein